MNAGRRPPRVSRVSGLSLIECLLAFTLFATAAALTSTVLVRAYRHSLHAWQLQQALRVASNVLESLRATGSATLVDSPPGMHVQWSWQPTAPSSHLYEATVEIQASEWIREPLRLQTMVWRPHTP